MSKFILPLFEHSPLLTLPIVSLLIFMVVFVVVTVRALKQPANEVSDMARAPLDDGMPIEGAALREAPSPQKGGAS
jgi:hypothetical protein